MGLLGAIGAGVGAGLEGMATDMRQESAFQRQMQMLRERMTMESEQRRADKTWELEQGDARRKTPGTTEFDQAESSRILREKGGLELKDAQRKDSVQGLINTGSRTNADGTSEKYDPATGKVSTYNADGGLINTRDIRDLQGVSVQDQKKQDLGITQAELSIQATKAQMANLSKSAKLDAIRLEEASIKLDQLKNESKIPPAVKAKADMLREEIKTINKTIYDKEAQNTLTPEGQSALTERVSKLSLEVSNLYEPYMPKGENGLPVGAKVRDFSSLGKGNGAQSSDSGDAASSGRKSPVTNVTRDDIANAERAQQNRKQQAEINKRIAQLETASRNGRITAEQRAELERLKSAK